MARRSRKPASASSSKTSQPKRKATIDLEASEVSSKPASEQATNAAGSDEPPKTGADTTDAHNKPADDAPSDGTIILKAYEAGKGAKIDKVHLTKPESGPESAPESPPEPEPSSTDAAAAAAAVPPQTRVIKKGGLFTALVSGITGAAAALFAVGLYGPKLIEYLPGLRVLNFSQPAEVRQLAPKLEGLERQIASLRQARQQPAAASQQDSEQKAQIAIALARIDDLDQRVKRLAAAQDASATSNAPAQQADNSATQTSIAALTARLDALDKQLADLSSQRQTAQAQTAQTQDLAQDQTDQTQLAALTAQIAQIRQDVSQKLAAFDQKLVSTPAPAAQTPDNNRQTAKTLAAVQATTGTLKADITRLRADVNKLTTITADLKADTGSSAEAISALRSRLVALERTVQGLSQRLDQQPDIASLIKPQIAPLQQQLAGLEQQLQALARQEAAARHSSRNVGLVIAMQKLKQAITAGRPFQDELNLVQKLAANKLDFNAISTYAQTGVQTLDALRRQFDPAADRALAALRTDNHSGLVDQIVSGARQIVKIKQTGPTNIKGNGPDAIIARIKLALANDNLKQAMQETRTLPAKARQAMGDWLKAADASLAAHQAIANSEAQLLAAIDAAADRP